MPSKRSFNKASATSPACVSVDPSQCAAQLSDGSTRPNEGVSLLVTLKDEDGAFLPAQSVDDIAYSVCGEVNSTSVSRSDSATVTLKFARFHDNQLKADFVPQDVGEFVVTVKVDGQQVHHSPLRLRSEAEKDEEWAFCAKTCPENAVLSNRNKTAAKRDGQNSHAYVPFSTGFARGKHSWKVVVDGTINDGYSTSVGVKAYASREGVRDAWKAVVSVNSTEFAMKSKDIVHCEFCCDTNTFTVTNERTMTQKKKKMSSEKDLVWLIPYVYLYTPTHSYTILS